MHGLLVARILVLNLTAEAFGLILGVVQLGKTVGYFATADEEFEAVSDKRVVIIAPRQR